MKFIKSLLLCTLTFTLSSFASSASTQKSSIDERQQESPKKEIPSQPSSAKAKPLGDAYHHTPGTSLAKIFADACVLKYLEGENILKYLKEERPVLIAQVYGTNASQNPEKLKQLCSEQVRLLVQWPDPRLLAHIKGEREDLIEENTTLQQSTTVQKNTSINSTFHSANGATETISLEE